MKYFRVEFGSLHMCGFQTAGFFKAESEEALWFDPMMTKFEEEMFDYVSGWVDEEDFEENEDADAISCDITEITEEEYLEYMEFYKDSDTPYQVG
jgi:hypothetical protein